MIGKKSLKTGKSKDVTRINIYTPNIKVGECDYLFRPLVYRYGK